MAQNLQRTLCNISSFPKSSHPNHTTSQRNTSNLFVEKFRSRNSYRSHHLRMVERFSFDRDEFFKIQKKSLLLPHAQSAEIQVWTILTIFSSHIFRYTYFSCYWCAHVVWSISCVWNHVFGVSLDVFYGMIGIKDVCDDTRTENVFYNMRVMGYVCDD